MSDIVKNISNVEIKMPLMLIIAIMFAIYALWFNFYTQWGMIDDHEVMLYLGYIRKWNMLDVFRSLHLTEIWNPGTSIRYRPFYYFFRLVEVCLWGGNPLFWYLFRFALFVASFLIFWRILLLYIKSVPSLLFTLYIFTFGFWSDIWTRLGPSETYAVLGFGLYSLGWLHALKSVTLKDWIMMLTGAIIAMGSKENFLILLIPAFVLTIILYKKGTLDKFGFFVFLVIFGFGGFIATAIGIAVGKTGHDIYNNSTNFVERIQLLAKGMENIWVIIPLVFVIVFFLFFYLPQKKTPKAKDILTTYLRYLLVLTIIFLFYLSQFIFYNGVFPTHIRYDFPGVLAGPALLLSSVIFILNIVKLYAKKPINEALIISVFSIGLIILNSGYGALREASKDHMFKTRYFTEEIMKLANTLKKQPYAPFVLESDVSIKNWGEYEPLFSIPTFLAAYGVKNSFYCKLIGLPASFGLTLKDDLIKNLQHISENGDDLFKPIKTLQKSSVCYSASFSDAKPTFNCKRIPLPLMSKSIF